MTIHKEIVQTTFCSLLFVTCFAILSSTGETTLAMDFRGLAASSIFLTPSPSADPEQIEIEPEGFKLAADPEQIEIEPEGFKLAADPEQIEIEPEGFKLVLV